MAKQVTYRDLFKRLKEFGYTDHEVEINGLPQHVFVHKDIETATITIPQCPLREPVHSMHLARVRAILKANDLLPKEPALF